MHFLCFKIDIVLYQEEDSKAHEAFRAVQRRTSCAFPSH